MFPFRFFSWWDEEFGKRRYKYYSNKNYGEKKSRRRAVEDQQKILSHKAGEIASSDNNRMVDLASQGVNFNKRTGQYQ